MEPPLPAPRKAASTKVLNSDSTDIDDHGSGSPLFQNKTFQVVHAAEVHKSIGDSSTNVEENNSIKSSEKRKKKLKRKGTFSVHKSNSPKSQTPHRNDEIMELQSLNGSPKKSHSGTETLSEASSSPSSNKIKLIPLLGKERRKKPSGYATETLSEDSGPEDKRSSPQTAQKQKEEIHTSEGIDSIKNSESESSSLKALEPIQPSTSKEVIEVIAPQSPKSNKSSPPVPLPRRSVNQSLESLRNEKQTSSVNGSPQSYCTTSSMDYKDSGSLPKQRFKKQRKKKKLRDQSNETLPKDTEDEGKSTEKSPVELKSPGETVNKTKQLSDKFICLTIHNCEPLKVKDLKTKPYVKVTFMDTATNKIKVNAKGENIQSLESQPFDFSYHRSTIPTWNEDLIVLEPLEIIHNTDTVLIIEILDEEKAKDIAWAFLRPVAANGATNAGQKLRLQLFKQGKPSKDTSVPQAFHWWKRRELKKYKSTLFLTLSGIPKNMIVQNNPEEPPMKSEIIQKSPDKSVTDILTESEDRDLEDVKWGRLPSLSCKLPNKYLARLPAGPDGSIAIAYSHSGLLLASANKINVSVFTFRGRPYLSLQGHTGLVYSIKWSSNDKYLLSASADFSTCVWDVGKKITTPIQVVSHPSYVYCCAWLDNHTFATGCFDSDIRIWKIGTTEMHQQASRHIGQINTLLTYDNFLVSGDSTGAIFIWLYNNSDGCIQFERELQIREIKGKIINKISIHPGKKRLLIHTRDSVLRMVDIATGAVLHWFQGLVNTKLREDSTFCGCGSLVLAWSEDSTLCVWDSNTGAQAAIYPNLIPDSKPGVVDFHPRDHMMVVSAHSHSPTLSILTYDRKSNGREVSLVPLNGNINPMLSNMKIPYSDKSSESTPKKKDSLLKTLLGGNRRKQKKNTPSLTSLENSFADFTRLHNSPTKKLDLDTDIAAKESRLTDIIKRMDKILTAVSHNNSSVYTS